MARKPMAEQPGKAKAGGGDLSVTALYTSYACFRGGFEAADLFVTRRARRVFWATNFVLKAVNFVRPGPVLASSLAQRHAMFDRVLEDSKATQVVEIAAGLSQRGAVFSKDPRNRYVEIDLPRMVAAKRRLPKPTFGMPT
jgi:O-methyltransferase involved in polyketide biosynthesis